MLAFLLREFECVYEFYLYQLSPEICRKHPAKYSDISLFSVYAYLFFLKTKTFATIGTFKKYAAIWSRTAPRRHTAPRALSK